MRQKFFIMLLTMIFIIKAFSYAESCIEIKERRNLPDDIYRQLRSQDAILLGEVHGTNESVDFVEGMVDLWLKSGEKVLLGLEINQDNQPVVDQFMRSGDFELIKNMPFFKREFQDGRSSTAMADLIKAMYKKENLKIVCLDVPSAASYHTNRDSMMAANASAALLSNRDWKLITLTGNVHNKTELGGFGYPMGYWILNDHTLKLNNERMVSIDIVYEEGSSWNCRGNNGVSVCKEYLQGNLSGSLAKKYPFDNSFIYSEHDKVFFTRKISTAPPLNH